MTEPDLSSATFSTSTPTGGRLRRALRSRPVVASTLPIAAAGVMAITSVDEAPTLANQTQTRALEVGDPLLSPPSDGLINVRSQRQGPVVFEAPKRPGAGHALVAVGSGTQVSGTHGDDIMLILDFDEGLGFVIDNPMCVDAGCDELPSIAERIDFQFDVSRDLLRARINNDKGGVVAGDFRLQLNRTGRLVVGGNTSRFPLFEAVQLQDELATVVAQHGVNQDEVSPSLGSINTSAGEIQLAAGGPVQGDCGTATCTTRFSREATRNIRDGADWMTIAGGLLAIKDARSGAIVAGGAAALKLAASRYYENGNCLGIRQSKHGSVNGLPLVWPVQVSAGRYNCR